MGSEQLGESLVSPAETRASTAVLEYNISCFESNVSKDVHSNTGIGLKSTETSCTALCERRIGNVASRDGDLGGTDEKVEVRSVSIAAQRVTALLLVVLGAGNFGIVGLDDCGGQVEKGCTSVGNSLDLCARTGSGPDTVTRCIKGPVAW